MTFHNSRRESPQIIAEILDLCLKPQPKTRIMYRINLSYRQLQTYLRKLQKTGLIGSHHSRQKYIMQKTGLLGSHHSRQKYITTEKGLQFLQKWIEIQQILTEGNDPSFVHHPTFDNRLLTPLEFET